VGRLIPLHVYRTYFPDPPGGVQEAIRQICLATQALGSKNVIYCLSPNPYPAQVTRAEASVVRSRSWWAPASCDLGLIGSLQLFRQQSRLANVLHLHFPWPFGDLLRFAAMDRPSVLTYHSDIVRQRSLGTVYSPLMWKTLRSVKHIVATSPDYALSSPVLMEPSIREKVRIIPLGICESSYPKDGDESIFDRLSIARKEPYFLFLGVLRYYKGIEFLLRAACKIKGSIVLAGSGPQGRELKRLAESLRLKNIVFAGQVTEAEKVALIKSCRALVLPSHLRSEAFGVVLIEASMYERPMITCEIGTGTSFVNLHGETGLTVPPNDANALAEAMRTLEENAGWATCLGLKARERYERLFSEAALGRAYTDLYRDASG
jgi:glycosyltransferase involved in cell wall biosynthesis